MTEVKNYGLEQVEITFNEERSKDTWLLGFRRNFDFEAGQVIGLALEADGPRRLYSICSGEQEAEIRILYRVVDEGLLTPRLCDLEVGDSLWITGPRGEFTSSEDAAVWIATGTGIAPFYSMMLSGKEEGKILLWGNRYMEEYHFSDELQEKLGNNFIRCCSREEGPGYYPGRVNHYLQQQGLPATDLKYYLCGSAEMVVETRDLLIEAGISYQNIISEIYF